MKGKSLQRYQVTSRCASNVGPNSAEGSGWHAFERREDLNISRNSISASHLMGEQISWYTSSRSLGSSASREPGLTTRLIRYVERRDTVELVTSGLLQCDTG